MSDIGDVRIKIELYGVGTMEAIIIRNIAPFSAEAILSRFPFILKGRFSFGAKKYWSMPDMKIFKGLEAKKGITKVEPGDIVYNPKADELIIAIESTELPTKVNIVGAIKSNLDIIMKATNGLSTKFTKLVK